MLATKLFIYSFEDLYGYWSLIHTFKNKTYFVYTIKPLGNAPLRVVNLFLCLDYAISTRYIYSHTHTRTHARAHTHADRQAGRQARTHARTHAHTHTHTHTHTHRGNIGIKNQQKQNAGADSGGGRTRRVPPLKLEKI
jgi:hypothetical protein